MRLLKIALVAAAAVPSVASAGLLDSMIQQAAARAASQIVNGAVNGAVNKAMTAPAAIAKQAKTPKPPKPPKPAKAQPAPAQQTTNAFAQPAAPADETYASAPAASSACAPGAGSAIDLGQRPAGYPEMLWPAAKPCPAYSFADLDFAAANQAKMDFDIASKVDCDTCEGGSAFDGWAYKYVEKDGDYQNFEKRLLALPTNGSLSWKGVKYAGTIKLIGQKPLGAYPCRQYQWTLKDGSKTVAQRPGLFCKTDAAAWAEVV